MSSFRWGLIAAIIAFVISMGLGMLSDVSALHIFIRCLIFSAVFFGIGFGVKFAINNFFPELMFIGNKGDKAEPYEQADETTQAGAVIENSGEYAVPEMYRIQGETQELGNIEDLVSGNFKAVSYSDTSGADGSLQAGIDSRPEGGYNKRQGGLLDEDDFFEKAEESVAAQQPVFTPSFGNDSEGLAGLPDLDAMAMAFSSIPGAGPRAVQESSLSGGAAAFIPMEPEPVAVLQEKAAPDRSQYTGNKPQTLEGDFDPKELAEGIRTVLNKDK